MKILQSYNLLKNLFDIKLIAFEVEFKHQIWLPDIKVDV